MDEDVKAQRRKEQRKLNRSKVRQSLLITDYVQYKYFGIYAEAVEFYNALNRQHPTKYDLRKAEEYKEWKMQVTGQTGKTPKRSKTLHPNIEPILNSESPYTGDFEPVSPIEINPEAQITVTVTGDSQPSSPGPSEEPSSPDPSEEPPSPDPSEEPPSPDPSEEPPSPDPSEEPPSPDPSEEPPSPDPSEEPPSPDPSEEPTRPVEPRKHVYTDNLELRIPLISHKSKASTGCCTVTTETLQTVTEEILEEDVPQPSLYDELSQELIDKIIEELRAEPDLKDMFTSIEQQLKFDQLGMDIDINIEDNALDIELEQW